MQFEYRGYVYDLRTMDEDPDYDNAPELNRMLSEVGMIHLPRRGSYTTGAVGPFRAPAARKDER